MKYFVLTKEACQLIRAAAQYEFIDNTKPSSDGNLRVPLSADVVKSLKEKAFEGETMSDTIVRLFASHGRKLN